MFENAVRNKYRFPTNVGWLNVEDLWDLSAEHLDDVYKRLSGELKKVEGESLLTKASDINTEIKNKIDIVKYVFDTKIAEQEARNKQHERASHKQFLMGILKQKQTAEFEGKSIEDLQKMIDEL